MVKLSDAFPQTVFSMELGCLEQDYHHICVLNELADLVKPVITTDLLHMYSWVIISIIFIFNFIYDEI
jgi:hypothetical protein